MAVYVSSALGDNTTGAGWSTAYTTLAGQSYAAGEIVYVDSNHSESTAGSVNISASSANPNNPITIISVDATGSPEPPTTYLRGASVTTTSNGTLTINSVSNSDMVIIGIDFESSGSTTGGVDTVTYFEDCTFYLNTGNNSRTFASPTNSRNTYSECTFRFGTASQALALSGAGCNSTYIGCSINGSGSSPDNLIGNTGDGASCTFIGCDWSLATNLVEDISGNPSGGTVRLSIWHTEYGTDIPNSTIGNQQTRIEGFGVSTDTGHEDIHIEDSMGQTNNDTAVYKDATFDGTTNYSLKTVATGNAEPGSTGHRYKLGTFYADANPTITVEFASASAETLNGQEVWIDIIAPDSTGPTATRTTSLNANYLLGTADTLSTRTSTWTGTVGTEYYVSETISGSQAGIFEVWVNFAPSSAKTVYVDPFITVA